MIASGGVLLSLATDFFFSSDNKIEVLEYINSIY